MIARLAARQRGVVARRQLLTLGLSRDAIALRRHDGRLLSLHAGVYAVGHRQLRTEGKWFAAVLACGPGAVLSHRAAVLSHRAAAAAWGPAWSDRIEVSAVRTAVGRPGIVVHRPRRLTDDDRTTLRCLPVTTVSRTLTDLADVVDGRTLRKLLEQAEILLLDADPEVIPGRRGAGRLAAALAELEPHAPLTRSELEDRFLEVCRHAGLPPPLVNIVIEGMEVDFCWPAAGIIVETDGWATHGTRAAFGRDRRRSTALSTRGWIVVRFTYEDVVRDAGYVVETLHGLLAGKVGGIGRA